MQKLSGMLSNDSLFGRIFGKAGDIIITNLLFILCAIPLVTAGASFTAMMDTLMALRSGTCDSIAKHFFKSFKAHLKQSTAVWLITVLLFFILAVDIHSFGPDGPITMPALQILCMAALLLALMCVIWLFPLISRIDVSLKELFSNAFLLAVRNLPYTLLMTAGVVLAYLATVMNFYTLFVGISIWVFFGFGLIGDFYSVFILKGFEKNGVNQDE